MRSDELLPDRDIGVVSIDHRDPLRRQAGKYFAFRMRNAFDRTETFQMRRARVVDQGDIRLRDARQIGNFAGVIGAHFDNRIAMAAAQP